LDEFNKEMSKIKSMSDRELEENTEGINWDLIAKTYVPARPGEDCKIQWLASGHPSINRSAWTKPEDKKLLDLVEKYRGYRWVDISKELGTNRTPAQCFMRSSNLKPNIVRGCWTKEEDRTLGAAVQRYGPKNWQQVANCLKGRTGQQCLHRWTKTVNPAIKSGRWELEEDKILVLSVKAYAPKKWVSLQAHIPGRTDVQCRERWVNILDPQLNKGNWTKDEDTMLLEAVKAHGHKWSVISQLLPQRTDNQCWRRWKLLEKNKPLTNTRKRRHSAGSHRTNKRSKISTPPIDPTTQIVSTSTPSISVKVSGGTINEQINLSLPLVMPSPITFKAVYKLLTALDEVTTEQITTPLQGNEPPIKLDDSDINSEDFKLLATWFNSLFLYPMLVLGEMGIIK